MAECVSETAARSPAAAFAVRYHHYRIQADRLGDLDHETRQVLDRTDTKSNGVTMSARLVSFDEKRNELTPGTVLVREWDRRSQRVMGMADGFAWNGQTYDRPSKVA